MRVTNKVSYPRGEKSVDDEGWLIGIAAVAVGTAVVVEASAAMAIMTVAAAGASAGVAMSAVVAAARVVVWAEAAVIVITNRTSLIF